MYIVQNLIKWIHPAARPLKTKIIINASGFDAVMCHNQFTYYAKLKAIIKID